MNPTVSRLAVGAATAAASIAARRAVEVGWRRVKGEDPPAAGSLSDDADLRDLFVWSAILVAAIMGARRIAESTARRFVG